MLRGGSWNNNANNTRSANRNRNTPSNRNNNNGFRVLARLNTLYRQNRQKGFCREHIESTRHDPVMPRAASKNQTEPDGLVALAKNNSARQPRLSSRPSSSSSRCFCYFAANATSRKGKKRTQSVLAWQNAASAKAAAPGSDLSCASGFSSAGRIASTIWGPNMDNSRY